MSRKAIVIVLSMLLWSTSAARAQGTRVITGTIMDRTTDRTITGAIVVVAGTDIGAVSELDGSFILVDVPLGDVLVEISGPGYQSHNLSVPALQNHVRIELERDPDDDIVVIGRAPPLLRGHQATGATAVRGDALDEVPHQSLDSALYGKAPAADIQANSGAPGGGMQIDLRGVTTIVGRSDVLYVVDGTIVSDVAIPSGINVVTAAASDSMASDQDNPVNRIADLSIDDIERIEVLGGAAATALYGAKGSNGVVVITTRRGRAGKPRITITQRLGFSQLSNTLGKRTFETLQEAIDTYGDTIGGVPIADVYGEGTTFDHERQLTQHKLASNTIASMSGGTDATRYRVSASLRDEPGILIGTGHARQSARLALDQDIGDRLELSLTSSLIHSVTSRGMTNNDNNSVTHYMVLTATPSFFDLRPYDDGAFPTNPFVPSQANPLQTVALMNDEEEIWRTISTVAGNLRIWNDRNSALVLSGNLGMDQFRQDTRLLFPRELHFQPIGDLPGTAIRGTANSLMVNGNLNLVYSHMPTSASWRSITALGLYHDHNELDIVRAAGVGLPVTSTSVGAAVSVNEDDSVHVERDQSVAVQQELLLHDGRLSLLAAMLAERNSTNGHPERFFLYPKASMAYRIATQRVPHLDLLHLRAAYGESANKPSPGDASASYLVGNIIDGNTGIVLDSRAPNPDLEPERQREIEAGFDLSLLDGRGVVELTVYQSSSNDLILLRNLAPSTGFTTQLANTESSIRNRGIELVMQLTPVRTRDVQWRSQILFALNRSKVTRLAVPSYNAGGLGLSLGVFRIEEGQSATQIVGRSPGFDEPVKVGDIEPDLRMSFIEDFTYKGVTLHALLDWQKGSNVINLTRLLHDANGLSADYEQAGSQRITDWAGGDTSVYIEDASFLKLREISLSYALPRQVVQHLGGMDSATVSVSARNLVTITGYSGLDPEVSNFGRQSIARNIDVAPYPPSRSLWFSIEAGF